MGCYGAHFRLMTSRAAQNLGVAAFPEALWDGRRSVGAGHAWKKGLGWTGTARKNRGGVGRRLEEDTTDSTWYLHVAGSWGSGGNGADVAATTTQAAVRFLYPCLAS